MQLTLQSLNQYSEALAIYTTALPIMATYYGDENHIKIVRVKKDYAELLTKLEMYADSLEMYEKALIGYRQYPAFADKITQIERRVVELRQKRDKHFFFACKLGL